MGPDAPGVRTLLDLTGRRALVTGGGTGLGLAIARGLAEMGAAVAVAGRRPEPLEKAVAAMAEQGGTAVALTADLLVDDGPARLIADCADALGGLDVLVNSAGVTEVVPSTKTTPAVWDRIVDTNLRGAFFTSAAAADHLMTAGHGGAIVNIASIGALRGGAGVYSAYSASKGGVVAMTRSHAAEWARHGIRVNCIAAGAFRTEMSAAAYEDPETHARYVRRIPLRRTGEPHEIAPLAAFLASDAAGFITGEVITIDGGQVMR